MKKGYIFSIVMILAFSLCASLTGCLEEKEGNGGAFDEQVSSTDEVSAEACMDVSSASGLAQMDKAEFAAVKKELITPQSEAAIKAALDNGTIVAVNHLSEKEAAQIAEVLGIPYEAAETAASQKLQGVLILAGESGEYRIEEVIAEIAQRADDKKKPEQAELEAQLSAIRENEKIDVESIYGKIAVPGEENAEFEKSANFVIYAPSSKADAAEDGSGEEPAWGTRLATVRVSLYGRKIKTSGRYQYDSFTAKVSAAPYKAGGEEAVSVREYHVKLSTEKRARYQTIDYTRFEDSGESTPGGDTIGAQDIENHTGYQYTQWWNAKPAAPGKGVSYEIAPSIITKIKDAETRIAAVKAVCSYVYLSGPLTAEWKAGGDKSVKIKFRNHRMVQAGA